MADQFSVSEEVVEEDVSEALRDDVPIDPERPGFASLLAVMRAAREDKVDRAVQVAYFQKLKAMAEEARASLEALPVPEALAEKMAPALAATQGMVGNMQEVVNLFGDWLASAHVEYLDQAITLLEAIHGEIRQAARSRAASAGT